MFKTFGADKELKGFKHRYNEIAAEDNKSKSELKTFFKHLSVIESVDMKKNLFTTLTGLLLKSMFVTRQDHDHFIQYFNVLNLILQRGSLTVEIVISGPSLNFLHE